jgi:uncharacterized membrane protein
MSQRVRRTVLTAHIIASVGLLGDCAAVLAINVRAATTGDPGLAAASYELLDMFSFVFGIPLSFAALGTGLALGLGTLSLATGLSVFKPGRRGDRTRARRPLPHATTTVALRDN